MKAYGGVDVSIHIFLTSALAGGEWSASRPGRFTPGTNWIGGWVDPRAGLDNLEKRKFLILPGLELRTLSHPARSQSLNVVQISLELQPQILIHITKQAQPSYCSHTICRKAWWHRYWGQETNCCTSGKAVFLYKYQVTLLVGVV
jgi:hypothetical protein